MQDNIIRLLSETVSNQIAAGEVVQRPASVVKELLENSLDAGADTIQLIVRDAGKTLIQVTDNGCGMNEIDARLSFERHATSKISTADDLYRIRTMGFRGEALASIASVAQVELKTRLHDKELGTLIKIEGNQLITQEHCQCSAGTSLAVKNLFFNVPARRNFLKSDSIELRHIYDEFHRIALAHPHVKFSFTENNTTRFQLENGNLKNRIVKIFGTGFQKKVFPVQQETDYLNITGFLVKPEFSKKNKGEQFFFINKRYIRNFFLHRIVCDVFRDYIPVDLIPGYFLFLEINPDQIDINVHPTKTEIVFRDEHTVALMLKTSLRYAIGSYNISPSMDFETEPSLDLSTPSPDKQVIIPQIRINPDYNPFRTGIPNDKSGINYNQLVYRDEQISKISFSSESSEHSQETVESSIKLPDFLFVRNRFIVTTTKLGLLFVDTYAASQRIIYEKTMESLTNAKSASSQQLLFPETLEFSNSDTQLLNELIDELERIGFGINCLGRNTFSCFSTPIEFPASENLKEFLESLIEQYKFQLLDMKKEKNIRIASAISKKTATVQNIRSGEEMQHFIEKLFSTEMPEIAPDGTKTYWRLSYDELVFNFKNS